MISTAEAATADAALGTGIPRASRMQRAEGRASVGFSRARTADGTEITALARLAQSGSAKIRLPKVYDGVPVAVLLNTAGGITGGDRLGFAATVTSDCHAVITTQAAERAYRSQSGAGEVHNAVAAGDRATVEWLPQETMLFEHSHLDRSLTVDLTGTARFIGLEMVVLGREAMGETVTTCSFRDAWRIRRDGRLVYADTIRFGPDIAMLDHLATARSARAFATFVDCGPQAEGRLLQARDLIAALPVRAGVSAWNGQLVARFLSPGSRALRDSLITFLEAYRSAPLPRVWHC